MTELSRSSGSSARVPASGDVVAGRYELLDLVGEGAMGAVWKARHLQLDSLVAIKLMSPGVAQLSESLGRFLREARAAAKLSSLHVVKVFDFGIQNESPFLVMELLEGESVRQRLERQGRLSAEETRQVVRHCCRALAKAHAAGIVHRDLKPENLFFAADDEKHVKVLDFGIAKVADTLTNPEASHTRTGAVLGTPYYMSPEQVRGVKSLDHRADLWSLAVIAFECLTGRLPFEGETFGDLVFKICTEEPQSPSSFSSVPPGLDNWFVQGIRKDPAQRFSSAEEMSVQFERLFGSGAPVTAPLPPPRRRHLERSATERPLVEFVPQMTGASWIDVTAAHSVRAALGERKNKLLYGVLVAGGVALCIAWVGGASPGLVRSAAPRDPSQSLRAPRPSSPADEAPSNKARTDRLPTTTSSSNSSNAAKALTSSPLPPKSSAVVNRKSPSEKSSVRSFSRQKKSKSRRRARRRRPRQTPKPTQDLFGDLD